MASRREAQLFIPTLRKGPPPHLGFTSNYLFSPLSLGMRPATPRRANLAGAKAKRRSDADVPDEVAKAPKASEKRPTDGSAVTLHTSNVAMSTRADTVAPMPPQMPTPGVVLDADVEEAEPLAHEEARALEALQCLVRTGRPLSQPVTPAEIKQLRVFVRKALSTTADDEYELNMAIYEAVQAAASEDPIKRLLRCFVGCNRARAISRLESLFNPPSLTFADAARASHNVHRVFDLCVNCSWAVAHRWVVCSPSSYDTLRRRHSPCFSLSHHCVLGEASSVTKIEAALDGSRLTLVQGGSGAGKTMASILAGSHCYKSLRERCGNYEIRERPLVLYITPGDLLPRNDQGALSDSCFASPRSVYDLQDILQSMFKRLVQQLVGGTPPQACRGRRCNSLTKRSPWSSTILATFHCCCEPSRRSTALQAS